MEAAAHVLPEHQWRPRSASAHVELARPGRAPAASTPPSGGGVPATATGPASREHEHHDDHIAFGPPRRSLNDRDRRILEFERHWWKYAGAKEQAIRTEFALSATRYYQILNVLIDSSEALVAEPMLVRRLRRLRAQRRQARAGRSVTPERSGAAMDHDGVEGDPAS